MVERCAKSDGKRNLLDIDANNLYGFSMSESYNEIEFDKNVKLEVVLKTPDDCEVDCVVEIDLKCPDTIGEK